MISLRCLEHSRRANCAADVGLSDTAAMNERWRVLAREMPIGASIRAMDWERTQKEKLLSHSGMASTRIGFARDPTGAARCRLGSTVAVLEPERAQ